VEATSSAKKKIKTSMQLRTFHYPTPLKTFLNLDAITVSTNFTVQNCDGQKTKNSNCVQHRPNLKKLSMVIA